MKVPDIFLTITQFTPMEFKDAKYFDELFTDEEVYAEMYPSFDQVNIEVLKNPNKKRTHAISERKCHKHGVNMWVYEGIRSSGKPYMMVKCPNCSSERRLELWKIKIAGNETRGH